MAEGSVLTEGSVVAKNLVVAKGFVIAKSVIVNTTETVDIDVVDEIEFVECVAGNALRGTNRVLRAVRFVAAAITPEKRSGIAQRDLIERSMLAAEPRQ